MTLPQLALPRILALDPAAKTGFAFSSIKDRVEHSGAWNLGATASLRLAALADHIRTSCRKWSPDVIAYETASFGSAKNPHIMRRHNELAGVIELVATEFEIPCWTFGPTSWKARAVGKGNADKAGVMRGLKSFFGIDVSNSDEADAIGILFAAQMGPPAESQKKQRRRAEKRIRQMPRLF